MKRARKHHYLPQFYLVGFTNDGTRDGAFFVLDQLQLKGWESTPEKAGAEIDLYTVTVVGGEQSDLVEKELAKLEAAVSSAVQQTVQSGILPTGEPFDRLINFIASLSMRTPAAFEEFVAMTNHFGKKAMRDIFPDDEACVCELTKIQDGRAPTDEELRSFKQFIKRGEYTMRPTDHGDWVKFMAVGTLQTTVSLAARHWSIVTAVGADFVCSDHPVVLCFNGSSPCSDEFRPGFMTPGTWLITPLSKQHALIGTLDGTNLRGNLPVEGVAWINRKLIERSHRFLIHSTDEIYWLNEGVVATKRELIEARACYELRNPTTGIGRFYRCFRLDLIHTR